MQHDSVLTLDRPTDLERELDRPRRPYGPSRATERREAIAESSGHTRNRRPARGGRRTHLEMAR
jgi:hypothetical protein